MTDILQTLTMKLSKPLDPVSLSIIREIHKASTELGFEVFMIGAMARIILLENVFGLSAGRTSNDIDFAFAAESWDEFQKIKSYLIKQSNFRESPTKIHQLLFKGPDLRFEFEIDLIPFGGIESQPNAIKWPPDKSVIMNVSGFKDALSTAVKVELEPDLIFS